MDDYKQIDGFPYLINSKGEIYSIRTKRHIRPALTKCGYLQARLWVNNKCYHRSVHRLVAETFIDNIYGKEQVNHKDGNKTNNNADNLEWVTRSENQWHRYNVLNRRGHNPSTKEANMATMKKVRCVETGQVYRSITEAAHMNGGKQSSLSSCLLKDNGTFKGRHWEYV